MSATGPARTGIHANQTGQLDFQAGFFACFTDGRLSDGFALIDRAAGQAPDFEVFAFGEKNFTVLDESSRLVRRILPFWMMEMLTPSEIMSKKLYQEFVKRF
jgi:hypothetical protein